MRGFRGQIEHPPDLVAYPGDEREVEAVLAWCAEQRLAAIPYGGGHERGRRGRAAGRRRLRRGRDDRPAAASTGCSRSIDVSRAARIQAGARGPGLEDQLREHGLTLRHFPQSFEFSTLGGWIATRAGGHFATLYTHIDDLVESVRAITPRGVWESRRLPGSGAGPSPDRLLLGSEGILGVITEAWVRVRERPRWKLSVGVAFDRLRAPAPTRSASSRSRVSTRPTAACSTRPSPSSLSAGPPGKALLVLGFESAHHPVEEPMRIALEAAARPRRRAAATAKGEGAAGTTRSAPGAHAFLAAPYLRDTLVACGVLSDTFETAITWDRFPDFHAQVMETARRAIAEACGAAPDGPGSPRLTCRFTHVYPDGPAPYYTVLAPGQARRRGRAVGRDQGGGLGDGDRRRRHDHPPPRGRPRPPPLVRPPAARAVRRGAPGRQARGRPAGVLNPGVLVDP